MRGRSSPLQHDDEVPGDELTHDGDAGEPVGEARVVARYDVEDVGLGLPPGPVQAGLHRDGEQGLTETVLGLVPVPASITLPRPPSSQEVPGRGLVTTVG